MANETPKTTNENEKTDILDYTPAERAEADDSFPNLEQWADRDEAAAPEETPEGSDRR